MQFQNIKSLEFPGNDKNFVTFYSAPLELHMVFYNTKYRSKAVALDMDDGLVVLATLYEVYARLTF